MGRDFSYRFVPANYNEDDSDDDFCLDELPFGMPRRGYVPIYDGVYTHKEALIAYKEVADQLCEEPDMGVALAAAAWAYILSEWENDEDDDKVEIIYS